MSEPINEPVLSEDPGEDYAGDTADEVVGEDDVEALSEVPD